MYSRFWGVFAEVRGAVEGPQQHVPAGVHKGQGVARAGLEAGQLLRPFLGRHGDGDDAVEAAVALERPGDLGAPFFGGPAQHGGADDQAGGLVGAELLE